MFRMLLQEALRWIVALTTLAGSGALIGTTPLFQEAAPPLEIELADFESPADEDVPEIVIEPAQGGVSGLAFHPTVMYRGHDECKEVYVARGSLKNHGPGVMTSVALTYTFDSTWVEDVTLSPMGQETLGTDKPLRFSVTVDTKAEWQDQDESGMIQVPITATATSAGEPVTATAMAIIYNACGGDIEDKPDNGDDDDDDDGMGIAGLAFHPGHLNSGGVCRTTYTAQGSLKNHGPGAAIDVTLTYTIPDEYKEVIDVELVNGTADELTTSKPLRFTVNVHVEDMEEWQELGKGASITIQISAQGEGTNVATATMTVRNQCKGEDSKIKGDDEPGAKGKPDKPSHPLGGPPGQKDEEERSHPLGGPPGQDKDKPNKKPK